jgi:hypothetical protein
VLVSQEKVRLSRDLLRWWIDRRKPPPTPPPAPPEDRL